MKTIRKTILDIDIDTHATNDTDSIVQKVQEAAKRLTANIAVEKNSFPLRPSSALKPERDLYYGLVNYYKPGTIPVSDIEGRSCMLLSLGHVIEKHLVEFLRHAYKIPFTAQKITYGTITTKNGPIVLGGELDFIIELPSGELVLADSKSSADFPFKKEDVLKDSHVAQLNLYLHSDWCKSKNITRALTCYYNKNTSDLKVREFQYDERLATETVARFQRVHDAYEAGNVPKLQHILGIDWEAKYSMYRDYEWSAYKRSSSRSIVTDVDDSKFPRARKDLLKHIIVNFGNSHVRTTTGKELYAEMVGDDMFLRETDSDGFSS